MATGRLGNTQLTTSAAPLYTVPTGYYSVFNISFTNTSTSSVTIRLALTTNGTSPSTQEYIEYDTTILGKGVFERTGLVLDAGKIVSGLASTGAVVNVTIYGIETSTS